MQGSKTKKHKHSANFCLHGGVLAYMVGCLLTWWKGGCLDGGEVSERPINVHMELRVEVNFQKHTNMFFPLPVDQNHNGNLARQLAAGGQGFFRDIFIQWTCIWGLHWGRAAFSTWGGRVLCSTPISLWKNTIPAVLSTDIRCTHFTYKCPSLCSIIIIIIIIMRFIYIVPIHSVVLSALITSILLFPWTSTKLHTIQPLGCIQSSH